MGSEMCIRDRYDGVLEVSRWHLKCEQDGTLEKYTRVVGGAFVSGKL